MTSLFLRAKFLSSWAVFSLSMVSLIVFGVASSSSKAEKPKRELLRRAYESGHATP